MASTGRDPKLRFSSRVENYIRYRPGYPTDILQPLIASCGLRPGSRVADIGSGPGNLARVFLEYGCVVTGVEPNDEMRAAGERLLGGQPGFLSQAGSAEATGLPAASFDFITAGQAFHWFDPEKTRPEFVRIIKPGGWLVLVWNERRIDASPFLIAYERLLRDLSLDYDAVSHRHFDPARIDDFFAPLPVQLVTFRNVQAFDYQALEGRALSSSYVPEPGAPRHESFLSGLRAIFEQHQQEGQVCFDYDTNVYYGQLSRAPQARNVS
jgi:SAM-dependent methyltransferase